MEQQVEGTRVGSISSGRLQPERTSEPHARAKVAPSWITRKNAHFIRKRG